MLRSDDREAGSRIRHLQPCDPRQPRSARFVCRAAKARAGRVGNFRVRASVMDLTPTYNVAVNTALPEDILLWQPAEWVGPAIPASAPLPGLITVSEAGPGGRRPRSSSSTIIRRRREYGENSGYKTTWRTIYDRGIAVALLLHRTLLISALDGDLVGGSIYKNGSAHAPPHGAAAPHRGSFVLPPRLSLCNTM